MIKFTIFGTIGLIALGVTLYNRARAVRVLSEYDEGRRCIACEGTDVSLEGDVVRCRACTHVARLSELRKSQLSPDEIRTMTDRRGP